MSKRKNNGLKEVELNSTSLFDYNTEDNRNRITVEESQLDDVQSIMDVVLSPHSVTIFKLKSN